MQITSMILYTKKNVGKPWEVRGDRPRNASRQESTNAAVTPQYLSKGNKMHNEIDKWLNEQANDNPVARAELARTLVKKVYDFVKFNRPEGEGLDGRDGPERQSLAEIVDATEEHYTRMCQLKHN